MESVVSNVCRVYNLTEENLMEKHAVGPVKSIKPMLWYYMVRDMHIPHRKVAARFGFSRRNILKSVRILDVNMKYRRDLRETYKQFVAAISDSQP